MLIKINKQIETEIEINFPYYTNEGGVFYAHYSKHQCLMVSAKSTPSITFLMHSNGFEYMPISETEFMVAFNSVMSKILSTLNQEKI